MLFLGISFCANKYSLDQTQSSENKCEYLELTNGTYDDLQIDADISKPYSNAIYPWDYSTILHAQFKCNLLAGNIDFTLNSVSSILIKKRKKDEYKWTTIHCIDITKEEDFNFAYNDLTAASMTTYEYAAVPIVNGVEGTYNSIDVDVWFDGAFVMDYTYGYHIILNYSRDSLTRTIPSSVVETMDSKYPYIFYTSNINYDKIQVSGIFLDLNRDTCQFDVTQGYKLRKEVRDFLNNHKAKIVKMFDGQIYLANIIDQISETVDGNQYAVSTTFTAIECGDIENNEDLYDHGFAEYLEVKV